MSRSGRPPAWMRPPGVPSGVWEYVHQRAIASRYDDFVADTPLCTLDQDFILAHLQNANRASDREPTVIVDLGCGTGRSAIPIAESGFDVVAVDLSQSMLEQLTGKLVEHSESAGDDQHSCQSGSVYPVRANLVDLGGLVDQAFDHAVCLFSTLGMIQGREHRVRFLEHAYRIVRGGGTFVLHVHRRWAALRESGGAARLMRSAWNCLREREHEFGDSEYAYRGLNRMFMHRFTVRSVQKELELAGWKDVHLDGVAIDGGSFTASTWNTGGWIIVCHKQPVPP